MAIERLDMVRLWQYWEEELALTGLQRHASRIRQQLSPIHNVEYRIELKWYPDSGQGKNEGNPPGAVMVELHQFLLKRRIEEAARSNCRLIVGQCNFLSQSHRSMERIGMKIGYIRTTWT